MPPIEFLVPKSDETNRKGHSRLYQKASSSSTRGLVLKNIAFEASFSHVVGAFNPIAPSNTQTTMSVTVMSLHSVRILFSIYSQNHNLTNPPTSYPQPPPNKTPINPTTISTNQRRALIAGSAAGFVVLLLLGGVFYHRRRKNKKFEFLDALAAPTQKEHSRAILLAGEDMDDFGSRLRGEDESFKTGHVRGGSAGGSGIGICRTRLQLHPGTRE
jgi:hypothetical protein